MRIAQVAPLFESVPPRGYGGTERVVSYLTEELVRQGHHVRLYATGDSRTAGELVPILPKALRRGNHNDESVAWHSIQLGRLSDDVDRYDVAHFHLDPLPFPLVRRLGVPALTTLHGRLDLAVLEPVFSEFRDVGLVSISNAQRRPLPQARWLATIYHGLPTDLLAYRENPEDYFAFVGRISPEKRVDRAIAIVKRLGARLRIAAKVDPSDREYFETKIRPLLKTPGVEYVGELTEATKGDFVGRAAALLFPIDWPEPFGLVMIEAFACGTPVIAWRCGSVPEVVKDGVTGFVVNDVRQAVAAARSVHRIERRRCRDEFERRFTVQHMAAAYVQQYERLAGRKPRRRVRRRALAHV